MSLSRLWQHQGEQAEARALLAPIYGWCTEGFDTAHLRPLSSTLPARKAKRLSAGAAGE